MAALSAATGVAVPTIKYYLRQGLLPAGEPTAHNQAEYSERHVRRLRLIRLLREVADLPVAAVAEVCAALDDPRRSRHDVLGSAHQALAMAGPRDATPQARAEVDAFLADLGWNVAEDAAGRDQLGAVLDRLRAFGWDVDAQVFARYADAADRIAAGDVAAVADVDAEQALERMVVGTIVFETALLALRRLAHEHHSASRFA